MKTEVSYDTCGDCKLWLTKNCPRERLGEDGRKRGPHCNEMACGKFVQLVYYPNKSDEEKTNERKTNYHGC